MVTDSQSNSESRGLVMVMTRPTDFSQEAEWAAWCDDAMIPETGTAAGASVVTRWMVSDRPPGFSPVQGFTHVEFYEVANPRHGIDRIVASLDEQRDAGRMHPCHAVVAVDAFRPTGRWNDKAEPSDKLRGHVISYVMTNDPNHEDDWNHWLDNVHVPDMIESGAFVNASRWHRIDPARWGADYLTVYDVELDDLSEAVGKSGAVMPGLLAAGRMFTSHYGGMRAMLAPAGRHGAKGWRPGA
jgi:hypothetical protein